MLGDEYLDLQNASGGNFRLILTSALVWTKSRYPRFKRFSFFCACANINSHVKWSVEQFTALKSNTPCNSAVTVGSAVVALERTQEQEERRWVVDSTASRTQQLDK